MSRVEHRVQVFSIRRPSDRTPRDKRRYHVKWRVSGRDKTRSFATKAQAERLKARLQMAVIEGVEFDLVTGLPVSWIKQDKTWWEWSQEWLGLKWSQWSGHSRRSAVESLVAITPLMARDGAPPAPDDVATWLREHGYRPGATDRQSPPGWLDRWSVPLVEVEPAQLERVLAAVTTKRDGSPMARDVARRRRTTLNAVLSAACRRELIDHNPLDKSEWKLPTRNITVDISTVPSYDDVAEIVDHVAGLKTDGARYAALFACVGIAGMRPSEAIGLLAADLALPREGWGLAVLRGASTSPGTRFTSNGTVVEDKELKQRPPDATRDVPLAPDLVERLWWHMERWPPVNGRVFTNAAGRTSTTTNYGPVWVRARSKLWPAEHRLGKTTVYDLRHSAATMMLRARVPPAEVARRLGHSVDILMRVYAGVFEDERHRSNELIDRAVQGTLPSSAARRLPAQFECGSAWHALRVTPPSDWVENAAYSTYDDGSVVGASGRAGGDDRERAPRPPLSPLDPRQTSPR